VRAVIYARVSSHAQRDKQTIESQLRVCPEFVAARGWQLVRPATAFVDDGMTARAGHLDDRVGFRRLLDAMAAKICDVVVVVDLDRLTRAEDLEERGQVLGAFQRNGVQIAIASTGQVLDLRSGIGDLLSLLGSWSAAEENRKRSERIKRGKEQALLRGRKPSGSTPYGFRYDRHTGTWSIDEGEAAIVRECFERVIAGDSLEKIAQALNARGLPSARGGRWYYSRVFSIVHQTAYVGFYRADKKGGRGCKTPPIVSDDTRRVALEALRDRPRKPRRNNTPALLGGIARCGLCGSLIRINGSAAGRRYSCAAKLGAARAERCRLPMPLVADLDAEVWARLAQVFRSEVLIGEALAARRDREPPRRDRDAEIHDLQQKLARLARVETGHLDRHRRGLLSDEGLDRELGTLARERDMVRRTLAAELTAAADAERERVDVAELKASVGALRARLDAAGPMDRRELVTRLVPGRDDLFVVLRPNPEYMAPARVPGLGSQVARRTAWTPSLVTWELFGRLASAQATSSIRVASAP
jgi:site-specific DNA recombinase